MSSYLELADAAVAKLTSTWFKPDTPLSWVGNDYWRTPTMLSELITWAQVAGHGPSDQPGLVETITNALNQGEVYIGSCGYYDDETTWGAMTNAAHGWLLAEDPELAKRCHDDAVAIFDDLDSAWHSSSSHCGGGIWWERDDRDPQNFKASNATLGYMQTALGLYLVTKTERYLEAAKTAWAWMTSHKLVDAGGMVWGGLTSRCQIASDNVPVVAQQGNPLAPLWDLYTVTGDSGLLDTAQLIVDGTFATMVWPGTQILQTPVDARWATADRAFREKWGNDAMFKGIFAGFLGNFAAKLVTVDDPARQEAARRYGAAMRANADSLAKGYPQVIYDMDWLHGKPDYQGDDDGPTQAALQFGAISAFVAAAQAP